ncbi:MAG: DUF975 family protein [Clostridia bacterium]|nr:DUF975 family protein [Clostridia bacterium]
MLVAKDFRYDAWNKLSGRWGTVVVAALIQFLITVAIGVIVYFIPYGVGEIISLLLLGPLAYGWAVLSLQVVREQDISIAQFFDGFKNFVRSFLLGLLNSALTLLWTLLLIVPGVIAALAYSMSYYILLDNPDMSVNEARKASVELMKGHKWRLLCLQASFLGWYLLCVLTLGILSIWIIPYVQTAMASFYQSLIEEQEDGSYEYDYDQYDPQPEDDYAQYQEQPEDDQQPESEEYGDYNGDDYNQN